MTHLLGNISCRQCHRHDWSSGDNTWKQDGVPLEVESRVTWPCLVNLFPSPWCGRSPLFQWGWFGWRRWIDDFQSALGMVGHLHWSLISAVIQFQALSVGSLVYAAKLDWLWMRNAILLVFDGCVMLLMGVSCFWWMCHVFDGCVI